MKAIASMQEPHRSCDRHIPEKRQLLALSNGPVRAFIFRHQVIPWPPLGLILRSHDWAKRAMRGTRLSGFRRMWLDLYSIANATMP